MMQSLVAIVNDQWLKGVRLLLQNSPSQMFAWVLGTSLKLPHIKCLLVYQKKQPPEVFCKKRCSQTFRKIYRETLVSGLFFNKACNFIKKETLTEVFSCAFCEFSNNIFPYRTTPVTDIYQKLHTIHHGRYLHSFMPSLSIT